MSLPQLRVVHDIPGRTRLRGSGHDLATYQALADAVAKLQHVKRVIINPRSGSVLIEHDASWKDLATQAKQAGVFSMSRTAAEDAATSRRGAIPREHASTRLSRWTSDVLTGADEAVHRSTRGNFDLRLLGLTALLGAGIWQWRVGKVLPASITLLWAALDLARAPHRMDE